MYTCTFKALHSDLVPVPCMYMPVPACTIKSLHNDFCLYQRRSTASPKSFCWVPYTPVPSSVHVEFAYASACTMPVPKRRKKERNQAVTAWPDSPAIGLALCPRFLSLFPSSLSESPLYAQTLFFIPGSGSIHG